MFNQKLRKYTRFFDHSTYLIEFPLLLLLLLPLSLSASLPNCTCVHTSCSCITKTYVPQLPQNITNIIFKDSNFRLTKEFMVNISSLSLVSLKFENTYIFSSNSSAFENFTTLSILEFFACYFQPRILYTALANAKQLTKLYIISAKIKELSEYFFENLRWTQLTHLSLKRCGFDTFNGTLFSTLKYLRDLDFSENFVKTAIWGINLSLNVLKIPHSSVQHLPAFVSSRGESYYPNLTHLEIGVERIPHLNETTCKGLQHLQHLYIWCDQLEKINSLFNPIQNLQAFHLRASLFSHQPKLSITSSNFRSKTLQNLTLENVRVFADSQIDLFHYFPSLINLQLIGTVLLSNPISINQSLAFLPNLVTLQMSFSNLKIIPKVICNMVNLTSLNLKGNRILWWNDTDCSVMKKLNFLSFSENSISIVEDKTFSPLLIDNKNLRWDLSVNPFLCTCENAWFKSWLEKNHQQFLYYPKDFKCETPAELRGKRLSDIDLGNNVCGVSVIPSVGITIGIVLGSLMFVFVMVASISYYKRWALRYICYLLKSRKKQERSQQDEKSYVYDAFICYHNSDSKYLLEKLQPKLEVENNFRLCIHDRDFIPGWDIVDNIVESIEKSHKIVLLLSNNFALSEWCQFESTMAQQRLFGEKKNTLIPILLEPIKIKNQTSRLTILLKEKTYLEWTDDKNGQKLFWARLLNTMRGS
uniref:Tool like receptor 13 n=1 Tax=Octopus vulgaris TaxID=6645 RepID=A0A2I7NB20_OCTVU|nr:tool like receptor 13 [Octopus vulgaris]